VERNSVIARGVLRDEAILKLSGDCFVGLAPSSQ
jgi:hypothetical protein